MPRSPEWVKAKPYARQEIQFKGRPKIKGRVKAEKSRPQRPPSEKQRPPGKDVAPSTRRGRPTPPGETKTPSGGRRTRRIERPQAPGQDVERGQPRRERQYGHAERIYPTGLEGDKRARHEGPPPRATPLDPGRQFKPIESGRPNVIAGEVVREESGLQRAQNVAYEIGKLAGGANLGAAKASGRAARAHEGKREITAKPNVPDRLALTSRAEPLGQMSLFDVPGNRGQDNLASAQNSRTERQASVPPSLAAGRQIGFARTNLPKKPGSQGTLIQPVSFRT